MTCFSRLRAQFAIGPDEQIRTYGQMQESISKALRLAPEISDAFIAARVYLQGWYHAPALPEQHADYLEKALHYAQVSQDLLVKTQVSLALSNRPMREAQATEDPEEASRRLNEYKESLDRLEPMCAILQWYGHKTGAELGFPPWGHVE